MGDGSFSITGDAAIRMAEIHRLVGALCLEIKGGRARVPNMALANQWSGSMKRTKKGALEDLVVWFYGNGGTLDAQWNTVGRALGESRTANLRRKAEKARAGYLKAKEMEAKEN